MAGLGGGGAGGQGGGFGGQGGGGGFGGQGGGGGFGGQQGALGAAAGVAGEPQIMTVLRNIIPDIVDPVTSEILSYMTYNLLTNLMIVYNSPSNLDRLELNLEDLDRTPKQVSIEAKFLTINVADLDKEGFQWDIELSDKNSRVQPLDNLTDAAYNYDINGDGTLETIPFYRRPDGSSVLNNTFTESVLGAIASPGPPGSFNLASMITDNEDGDKISVIFDYLNSLEESELLSAPRVTTMNQKPAAVVDLRQEWFVTQVFNNVNTTTGGFGAQPTTVVTQSLTPSVFMFGITLSVTPQIADNQIRLWLNPQVNSKVGEKVIPQSLFINDEEVTNFLILPEESMQSVWTNVIVNNGDTVVLGGLVTDRSVRAEERFPYLADIPLLGYFFRGKSAEIRQSSLLIFVTPTIIDTTGAEYFDSDSRL